MLRMVGGAMVLGIVAAYVAVNFYRDSVLRPRIAHVAKDRAYLSLTAKDDYSAVVRKLGAPSADRWDGTRFRALSYPERAYTVVLMSTNGAEATFVGVLDQSWHTVSGDDAVLRSLPRF